MKHEKYLSALVNCLLSVAIAMGGVGCMVTGLHLEVENMGGVFLACAITAALCCVSTFWRWGPLVLLAVAALVGGYLWREGTLLLQLESTVYHISLMYDAAYGWGVADWTGTLMTGVPTDMGLGFIACLCAAVIVCALWNVDRLLTNILSGRVFTRKNVIRIRRIVRCCGLVSLICVPASFAYMPLIFLVAVMAFLCLIVSVVAEVMDAAVTIREENDLTV